MEKRPFGVVIPLMCALQFLLFYSWGWAIPTYSGKKLEIPSQYGIIKEVFEEQLTSQGEGKTIIHLQDAHCNYEAQKNIAKVLEYLVKEYNLRLIMVEGGSGNVSLSFLRGYMNKEDRERIVDEYLKRGKISGEEYLDIVSDYDLELYGVEDEGLYDAHLSAFRTLDSVKDEGLKYVGALTRVAEALKLYMYSEPLKQLEKQKRYSEENIISLAEYCKYLKDAALMQGLNLDDYTHLSAFAETTQLEKEIDFQQAESERNAFIKDLANLLDERAVDELLKKSQDFKADKLTPNEYYSFLKAAAEQKLALEHNYPHLDTYIKYITVSKDIVSSEILKEASSLSEKIKESYFVNTDQRKLSEISKSLKILGMFLNLELTPEDYEYFQDNRSKFLSSSWTKFLSEKCRKYNLGLLPVASKIIDHNLDRLEDFYQLGITREEAFVKNIVNKMDESGQNLAVLITGGFHTPGITRMLKDKGYSYIVAAPVITEKSDSAIYFSVLKGEKSVE